MFQTQSPGSVEAEHFVYLMRRLEKACCMEVLTYALMANHFHILCKVPERRLLSWTANGFNILDANGNVVFSWADDRWVCREGMTVSWSPDSAHVVLMDHAPKAPMFFAVELRDGKWVNVPFHLYEMWGRKVDGPRALEFSRVTKAQVLNWLSPIMLQVQVYQSGDNRAEPENPIRVEYVTSLRFQNNEVFFAAQ